MGSFFNIYMYPPNVLISPINPGYKFIGSNNIGQWGEIIQINASTTDFNVGNVVFYNPSNLPLIYNFNSLQFYNVVDETQILYTQA